MYGRVRLVCTFRLQNFMKRFFFILTNIYYTVHVLLLPFDSGAVRYVSYYSVLFTYSRLLLFRLPLDFPWRVFELLDMSRLSFIVSWIRDALWCSFIHGAVLLIYFFSSSVRIFYLHENGLSFMLRFYSSLVIFFLVFFSEMTLNLAYNRPSHLER